jgi:hypothetical protein
VVSNRFVRPAPERDSVNVVLTLTEVYRQR